MTTKNQIKLYWILSHASPTCHCQVRTPHQCMQAQIITVRWNTAIMWAMRNGSNHKHSHNTVSQVNVVWGIGKWRTRSTKYAWEGREEPTSPRCQQGKWPTKPWTAFQEVNIVVWARSTSYGRGGGDSQNLADERMGVLPTELWCRLDYSTHDAPNAWQKPFRWQDGSRAIRKSDSSCGSSWRRFCLSKIVMTLQHLKWYVHTTGERQEVWLRWGSSHKNIKNGPKHSERKSVFFWRTGSCGACSIVVFFSFHHRAVVVGRIYTHFITGQQW